MSVLLLNYQGDRLAKPQVGLHRKVEVFKVCSLKRHACSRGGNLPSFTKGAADISILRIFPMTAVFVLLQCPLPILLRFYSSGEVFDASPALQETVQDPERSKGRGNVVSFGTFVSNIPRLAGVLVCFTFSSKRLGPSYTCRSLEVTRAFVANSCLYPHFSLLS